MRGGLLVVLLFVSCAASAAPPRHLKVINTTARSLTSFSVAQSGTGNWSSVEFRVGQVAGGGDAITLQVDAARGCVRDFKLVFSDGGSRTQRGFDICRRSVYRTSESQAALRTER
jgi:hypothetical protein